MENNLTKPARFMLAIAMMVLGIQHFIYRDFLPKLEPVPTWVPGRLPLAYFTGAIFILAALAIATKIMGRLLASLLGIMFVCSVLFFHIPILVSNLHDADKWTCTFEELAIGGGLFVLALTLPPARSDSRGEGIVRAGSLFFAISLVIFGILHFMYADYIATLIPSWIPARLFWAYFVGVAFFATTISIVIKKKTYLATTLLGFMFFFWEISLHIPRVIASPHNADEWTSAAIALAMSGSSFALAGTFAKEYEPVPIYQHQNS